MSAAANNDPMMNPGTGLANAVDSEMSEYRALQEQHNNLQGDLQTVRGQQMENEMVQTELNLLNHSSEVYKRIGPVLIRQDLDEAKQTVAKRLEFIMKEQTGIAAKLTDVEEKLNAKAVKIQEMQSNMQRLTAQAVQAIQQQHQQSSAQSSRANC